MFRHLIASGPISKVRAVSTNRHHTSTPTIATKVDYRREIDGLRAIAVLPVIFFHAGLSAFSGGFVGVDIFFVISGYLISSIIIQEISDGSFSIARFYERRARRILPALTLIICVCLPFAWFVLSPVQLIDFGQSLIAVSLFSSNILFWKESDYFSPSAEEKPLLHTWSLGVEEQFYFVAPILFIALFKSKSERAPWFIAGFALLSLFASQYMTLRHNSAAFYLAPFRAWELFAGTLAALHVRRFGVQARHGMSSLGLLLIAVSIFCFDDSTPFPGFSALLPVIGTVIVLLHGGSGSLGSKILSFKPLVMVGLLSYSAYLWHQPIFAFTRIALLEKPSGVTLLALSFVSLFLAYLSWRLIELPFRRMAGRAKWVAIFSGIALLVPIALGLLAHLSEGAVLSRASSAQREILAQIQPSPFRERCHSSDDEVINYAESCTYFGSGAPKVAVFGDSHAVELAYALALEMEKKGGSVRHLTYSDCGPAQGSGKQDDDKCLTWKWKILEDLKADKTIKTVVVSYRLYGYLMGPHEGQYPSIEPTVDARDRAKSWKELIVILTGLELAGKKTILVLQSPELPKRIDSLIFRQKDPNVVIRGVSRAWWDNRRKFVKNRLTQIPTAVTIYDPTEIFCDSQNCYAEKNGKPLYFDDDHISLAGAALVAKNLIPLLEIK